MYGISMGANLAASTARKLLDSGAVTQVPVSKEKNPEGVKPRMTVRLESPVSFGKDPSLPWI